MAAYTHSTRHRFEWFGRFVQSDLNTDRDTRAIVIQCLLKCLLSLRSVLAGNNLKFYLFIDLNKLFYYKNNLMKWIYVLFNSDSYF